ncbi:phosphoenolpyruvate phosphomutase-domain-containing protein [Xylogone sp. PMI_703]|nr:phosphoenolpyruvate phosphomutase-domain-containing protein [Xylogone sp. PMI_703]
MAAAQNVLAKSFKALHKPGSPIVLANAYDALSARTVASLPQAKAIATASYAVAQAVGLEDDDLTKDGNLNAVRAIVPAVKEFKKPVTVDFQDGYGDQLEEATRELVQIGVVGVNLEDYDKEKKKFYSQTQAAERIKRVLATANAQGVPDFVVNARCDTLVHGGELSEAIARGQAYLAAGATTVFVWGGSDRGGISRDEVAKLVQAFDGRLNVSMKRTADALTLSQLAKLGVARVSVGPTLQFAAMAKLKEEALAILQE